MTAGVLQGCVLEPSVWNVKYNKVVVLPVLKAMIVGYAVDFPVIVVMK